MNTKKSKTTKPTAAVKPIDAKPIVKEDKAGLDYLLERIQNLQKIKNYYQRLKNKRTILKEAILEMQEHQKNVSPFESEDKNVFPYEIVLNKKMEHRSPDEIFKITEESTVTNFSNALIVEIDEVLELLETDLVKESKTIN